MHRIKSHCILGVSEQYLHLPSRLKRLPARIIRWCFDEVVRYVGPVFHDLEMTAGAERISLVFSATFDVHVAFSVISIFPDFGYSTCSCLDNFRLALFIEQILPISAHCNCKNAFFALDPMCNIFPSWAGIRIHQPSSSGNKS
jgi:hypothetical protein